MPFTDFALSPAILANVQRLGFTDPTPIQSQAIPSGLEGRDILACAMTGSGKTAAFGLPLIERLLREPRPGTRALVLVPTRELAVQVNEHLARLIERTPLRTHAVYGGVAMPPQERALRAGTPILVATPGRLIDHLQYPYTKLDGVETLVLDEADRMLDMGFLPAIRKIIARLPKRRQTLFFSATMPKPIVALAGEMLRDPVSIDVARPSAPATGLTQTVYPVPQELKPALLVELVKAGVVANAIAFTRTKHRANRLAEHLQKSGITAERIHGNRSQAQRVAALEGFKRGRYAILVATDVAARGIDVNALEHVVNFDVPLVSDDYIHRVGRTARAERTGEAITFVAPDEEKLVRAIEKAIDARITRTTIENFDYTRKPQGRLEVPIGERLAKMRAERARSRTKPQSAPGRYSGR